MYACFLIVMLATSVCLASPSQYTTAAEGEETLQELQLRIAAELKTLQHAMDADGQGKTLIMVDSPSGKSYAAWRLPSEHGTPLTEAEENTVSPLDHVSSCVFPRVDPDKERIVVDKLIYIVHFWYTLDTNPSSYRAQVFENFGEANFLRDTSLTMERITNLRNHRTEIDDRVGAGAPCWPAARVVLLQPGLSGLSPGSFWPQNTQETRGTM